MPTKPDPQVSEPAAGYAQALERAADVRAVPLTAQQQDFLREALEDLAELDEYAAELDMPAPDPAAIEAAREFLHQAVRAVPRSYSVSPWGDGSVIVNAQGKKGFSVNVSFETNGSAVCFVGRLNLEQSEERHFSPAQKVANEWVFRAVRELEK